MLDTISWVSAFNAWPRLSVMNAAGPSQRKTTAEAGALDWSFIGSPQGVSGWPDWELWAGLAFIGRAPPIWARPIHGRDERTRGSMRPFRTPGTHKTSYAAARW